MVDTHKTSCNKWSQYAQNTYNSISSAIQSLYDILNQTNEFLDVADENCHFYNNDNRWYEFDDYFRSLTKEEQNLFHFQYLEEIELTGSLAVESMEYSYGPMIKKINQECFNIYGYYISERNENTFDGFCHFVFYEIPKYIYDMVSNVNKTNINLEKEYKNSIKLNMTSFLETMYKVYKFLYTNIGYSKSPVKFVFQGLHKIYEEDVNSCSQGYYNKFKSL